MAEGRFIQAERALLDFSLQHEEELTIEFFHELFEVRRQLGKDFPFTELNTYFTKLAEKENYQEITDLLNWWIEKNPKFESVDLYKWKLSLYEKRGSLHELEGTLKSFGIFLLNNKYWSHIHTYQAYYQKFFKNNYDFAFVLILYGIQTFKFSDVENILYQFTEDELIRAKKTAKTEDDIELILTLLEQNSEKGVLEIWKSFLGFYFVNDFSKVEVKKFIEAFIYFESMGMQLILLRFMHQWGQKDLAELLAQTIKSLPYYDFIIIEKYFSHDLKPYFIQKKKMVVSDFISQLTPEDLRLNNKQQKTSEREEEVSHVLTEEEALIISGIKYQQLTTEQALDLMVAMLQMSFPIAAREIGTQFKNQKVPEDQQLKLNYLLLQVYHSLKDYRAGLDIALDSLHIAKEGEDILAFTYAEADFYYLLGEKRKAKSLYLSILSLVGNYRMTKERLRELDEV
jgi:hypothetical protein